MFTQSMPLGFGCEPLTAPLVLVTVFGDVVGSVFIGAMLIFSVVFVDLLSISLHPPCLHRSWGGVCASQNCRLYVASPISIQTLFNPHAECIPEASIFSLVLPASIPIWIIRVLASPSRCL